jgi:molybdopterin synthase catalytic subunit
MISPFSEPIQSDNDRFFIRVSETLPSLQECCDFVSDPSCGAIATFVGVTRDNFDNKIVSKLSYEGYVPMAEKELRKLCHETCERFDLKKIAAVHILGDCPVGQASVILACSSPHRRDALQANEYLIDELKARVPIWKREVYQGDEQSVWKENIEWHQGKALKRVMIKEGGDETTSGSAAS